MSVKGIFKVLIGTILITILSCVIVEFLNVDLQSTQIIQLANLAGSQAAGLFAQETYKTDSGIAGSSSMPAVKTADGGEYISGQFYNGLSTEKAIYNQLYGGEFLSWAASQHGNWLSVDSIAGSGDPNSGEMYRNNCVTPLNMGVPYMDKDTLEKMFRWNLAQTFSNCNSEAIVRDPYGRYCVSFNGFRIYASQANIENIEYKVFDISTGSGAQQFYDLTHVNPASLNGEGVRLSLGTYNPDTENMITTASGVTYGDERAKVCVIGIEYSVPISYEGITPMRQIFSYLWHDDASKVDGFDGNTPDRGVQSWNAATPRLYGGGFQDGVSVETPVPSKLIYYIIR